jgi:citrate lyase subunit beta/citryl-CoA lyase
MSASSRPLRLRSKLFVPGSRPELFAKALAGPADALSFDLEDSVVAERKAEARDHLAHFLSGPEAGATTKTLIVRVNAIDSAQCADDIAAMALPSVALINLPKPESPEAVRAAADLLEKAERLHGVESPIGLLVNIETPRASRIAHELAAAHTRVAGLQLGLADLFEPLGIERRERAAVEGVMLAMRLAAGEAGALALDAAFADIRDVDGYRAEAALARRLGYAGKSCIHPSQVALANAAFLPGDAEVDLARRIVAAADDAREAGAGAYLVDGRMIDPPFEARARAVVAIAESLGKSPA